jgi:hypothetical protein
MAGMRLIFLKRNSLDVEAGLLLASGAKNCVLAGCSSSVSERELRKERCLLMMDSSRLALSYSFSEMRLSLLSSALLGFYD